MTARYTLVLGTKNWSSWSLRPYLALFATGHPFDEFMVRLRQPDTKEQILRHSPAGKVPVLKIEEDDQTNVIWDSLAICEAIAERHPQAQLWPDQPSTRAEARAYAAEMHAGFMGLRNACSMDFARKLPTPELNEQTQGDIARIVEAWESALARFGVGGGFLFGRFSIADAMYAPVVSRFLTYGIALPERSSAYAMRVAALPGMQAWGAAAAFEVASGVA